MAALGDERLFEALERDGPAIARGEDRVFDRAWSPNSWSAAPGPRWRWWWPTSGERGPAGGRITLNLGHSLGHAVEAAAGYGDLLHGEAVAYGLRAACRIGLATGVTPPERADRIGRLLDVLDLGREPLPYALDTVLDHLATDKKHSGRRLRWVLPTEDGVVVRSDIDDDVVRAAATSLLAAGSAA